MLLLPSATSTAMTATDYRLQVAIQPQQFSQKLPSDRGYFSPA
jgi:hypothetical protein